MDETFSELLGVEVNFQLMIQYYALLLARIAPTIFQTPFLGGEVVENDMRIGTSMILVLYFYPLVVPGIEYPMPPEMSTYIMLLIKEFFVGFTMGFLSSLPFHYIASVGNQIDTARGASQGQIQNPGIAEEVTILANYLYWMMVFLFLGAGGHIIYIKGLANSFSVISPTAMPSFGLGWTPFVQELVRLTGNVFMISFQLAAPVLIVCFIIDVIFGLFNKIASQINVQELSSTVKLLVGLYVFFLSLPVLVRQIYKLLENMLDYSFEMLTRM